MNNPDNSTTSDKSINSYVYKIGAVRLPQPMKLKHLTALALLSAAWIFLAGRVALLFSHGQTGLFIAAFLAIGAPLIAARAYRWHRERSTAKR